MHNLNRETADKIKGAEVLLIGCSAGGFALMYELLLSIPAGFPLSVIVVIHRSKKHKSSIEALLHKKAKVPIKIAEDQEKMKRSFVYFAPSGYHLLLEPKGTFTLDSSEPVFFCQPSIDVTFESVADVYKNKAIGMLLSGANQDGAAGLAYIEQNGGLAIIQDPDSAEINTMPLAALKKCKSPLILVNNDIFQFITQIDNLKSTSN